MPRFGMKTAMPKTFSHVRWYGRGPQETYWDRKTGGEIAIYESTVDDWVYDYIRPQDTGNRTDVRWATWTNAAGLGLKVTGEVPLSVSAWPYSQTDLEAASHSYELPRRDVNIVFIDDKLHGVGGDNSWARGRMPNTPSPATSRTSMVSHSTPCGRSSGTRSHAGRAAKPFSLMPSTIISPAPAGHAQGASSIAPPSAILLHDGGSGMRRVLDRSTCPVH